jgi:STAS-like domain of unknown function (DUF4325)
MKYDIYEIVGQNCISLQDGQKVYDAIYPELKAGHEIELDFAEVEIFASPFFNFAIGQLVKDIQTDTLNQLLKVSHLNSVGMKILKRVIENSKEYYSSPKTRKAIEEVLSEQAESL